MMKHQTLLFLIFLIPFEFLFLVLSENAHIFTSRFNGDKPMRFLSPSIFPITGTLHIDMIYTRNYLIMYSVLLSQNRIYLMALIYAN
jgi:hypothetical protein